MRTVKRTRKPDKREAFNVEHMSRIRDQVDAYMDGRTNIGGAVAAIHYLVQRIVGEHTK